MRAEAGRDEEAVHLALAEHELVVGREALRAVDQLDDVGVSTAGTRWQACLHQRREAVPVLGEQPVVEVRRHAVHRPRRRVALVAAEQQAGPPRDGSTTRLSGSRSCGSSSVTPVDGLGDEVLVSHRARSARSTPASAATSGVYMPHASDHRLGVDVPRSVTTRRIARSSTTRSVTRVPASTVTPRPWPPPSSA